MSKPRLSFWAIWNMSFGFFGIQFGWGLQMANMSSIYQMLGVGIAWASIVSMPYAMLGNSLPAEKMGFYMGVFNFFIVLPQITVALGLGEVLAHMPDLDSLYIVVGGGGCVILAAACTLFVKSSEHPAS